MLTKTNAIVLRFVKYRDSSIIVTVFTQELGLKSYIVNGVRSTKSKGRIALYQPLTLLNLVVYNKETADINRISEARCHIPLHNIATSPFKSAIAMFIAEVLNKTIKETVPNEPLFQFIQDSLIVLNEQVSSFENFHLIFLTKLSIFLGFGPNNPSDVIPPDVGTDWEALTALMQSIMSATYIDEVPMNRASRQSLLNYLLHFFNEHLEMGEVKSIAILKTLFD